MEYGQVKGLDKPVSRLALGTMIVHTERLEQSFQLLDDAVECGFTALDCAHVYGGGAAERAVGQWLRARDNRESIVILSKGCHHNQDRPRVTPFDLAADLHDSLARLQTDYIDIYVLHRDDPQVPVGTIVEALNYWQRQGRIRAFGGSNWTHERIQEANDYAVQKGLLPFTASSPHFSLAEQVEDPWGPGCVGISGPSQQAAQDWYIATQLPVFAYSSLARGFFSGRLNRSNYDEAIESMDNACRKAYCHEVNLQRLDRAEELAREKGVSVPQLALAYVLNQPLYLFPLVGAANRDELEANAAAVDLKLTAAECAWLDLRAETR